MTKREQERDRRAELKSKSNAELIKGLVWYRCDPYYAEGWRETINELCRRLKVERSDIWK